MHPRGKKRADEREKATAGEPVLATTLWGILYADDCGDVSLSSEKLKKMMGVIVVVCTTFGRTGSEAKTEIMCLHTKGVPESTAIFGVEAAGQVYKQTNEFVYLGGTSSATPTYLSRSTSAYATHDVGSGSTPSNCTTGRALPSSSKSGC